MCDRSQRRHSAKDDHFDLNLRSGCLIPLLGLCVLLGLLTGYARWDELRTSACNSLPNPLTCGADEFRVQAAILVDHEAGLIDFRQLRSWSRVCLTTQYQNSDERFYDYIVGEDDIQHSGRRIRGSGRIEFRVFDQYGQHLGHSIRVQRSSGTPRPAEYGGDWSVARGRQCANVAEALARCEPLQGTSEPRCIFLFDLQRH